MKIALADDHAMVIEGLRLCFESDPDCQVIGSAEDGEGIVKLVLEHQPDIAIIDVTMPGLNGIEAARQALPTIKGVAEVEEEPAERFRSLEEITAEYSLRDDGGINVLNRGYSVADREWESAEGKAYFVDTPDVGRLKVAFFGPFYGGYNIMALDQENYAWSMVAGPDRSYLWILSRSPEMDAEVYAGLLEKAREAGFPVEELVRVEHDG